MSKPKAPKLPKEAVKFAKSMGLDLDGLEPEAEDIWKMLDEMSNSNPAQYEQFVSQQLQSAKEDVTKKVDPKEERRSFRPTAGYSVETSTKGGDGLKIRDISSAQGKKFYINLCSSDAIEGPTDKAGKPIVGFRSVADGLNIPLIVGPVRGSGTPFQSAEKDMFVDVVLNPKILEMAAREQYFKAQIVDLALDWVIQETKVDCLRKWEFVASAAYKGGRGEKSDIPVLFFIDGNGAPVGQAEVGAEAQQQSAPVMASTASLLSQLGKEKGGTEITTDTSNIDIFSAKPFTTKAPAKDKSGPAAQKVANDAPAPKKPLIQEIGVDAPAAPPVVSPPKQAMPPAPAPKEPTAKKPLIAPVPTAAPTVEAAATSKPAAAAVVEPTKMEYQGMEQLLASFDEGFSTNSTPANSTFLDTEEANAMIANLAKVLSGSALEVPTRTPAAASAKKEKEAVPQPARTAAAAATATAVAARNPLQDTLKITNEAPAAVKVAVTVEQEDAAAGAGVLCLSILGLSSSLDTASLELLVSSSEVLVKIERRYVAAYAANTAVDAPSLLSFGARCPGDACRLVEASAAASFKKKKGVLVVKISYKPAC